MGFLDWEVTGAKVHGSMIWTFSSGEMLRQTGDSPCQVHRPLVEIPNSLVGDVEDGRHSIRVRSRLLRV
jgi:hypothetical protein